MHFKSRNEVAMMTEQNLLIFIACDTLKDMRIPSIPSSRFQHPNIAFLSWYSTSLLPLCFLHQTIRLLGIGFYMWHPQQLALYLGMKLNTWLNFYKKDSFLWTDHEAFCILEVSEAFLVKLKAFEALQNKFQKRCSSL